MLYIPALINGTPVKVFVDSGAQSTILSQRCAERCGIMRLVDRHFAGTAVGVGTSKIVGRVHMAPLIIAGQHFPCTFVVIESGSIDCLFGLDMLRRYQACIDLHAGVLRLRLGGTSTDVPFLGESEIPKDEVGGDGFAGNDKDPAKDGAAGGSAAASGSSAPAAGAGAGAPASSTSSSMQVDKPAAAASSHVSPVPTTSSTAPAAGGASTAPAGGAGAPPAPGAAGGGGAAPLFGPIDLSSLMPPGGRGGRRGR
jgi:DNA damage-inducible protein 1